MKTKALVFNDRHVTMFLQAQGTDGSTFHTLHANEYRVVELEIPEGSILYFKTWETGQALVSFIDKEGLAQMGDR